MDRREDASLWPAEDQGYALSLIRRRARRLADVAGVPALDQEDFEQELLLDLWQNAGAFDAARGSWHAFAKTVVCRAGGKILRRLRAKKRHKLTTSLSVILTALDESQELSQFVTSDEAGNRLGIARLPAEIRADLAMDLEHVTSTLSADQQNVLALFTTLSRAEVSQTTGIKRSTLNDRLKKLGDQLDGTGLKNYFEI